MEEKGLIMQGVQGGFASIATAFVMESLEHMIPWLMVMFMVILTDLAFGVRKSMAMHEKVRFSRAVRCTMGKMVTYFAFVCMVCMMNVAMGGGMKIDMYSCLLVCFIEGCSIIGNILKPKGVDLNFVGMLRVMASKATKVDKKDMEGIITEHKKRRQKNEGAKRTKE